MSERNPASSAESAADASGFTARPLNGMKAICVYVGKSENTVLKLIRDEALPASKIGGEWASDKGCIDAWRLSRIR